MNPFSKFRNYHTRSQQIPSQNMAAYVVSGGQIVPNHLIDAQYALTNSDVFAVVNLISSDVASAAVNAPEPFASLIKQPNNLISGFNFWQSTVAQLLLTGNAYVAVDYKQGVPSRMELVPAGNVVVTLGDSNSNISYTVNWQDERATMQYTSNEMLHFRLLATGSNDSDAYVGISPLQTLAESLNIQDFSQKLTLSSLKHGLNPSTVLTVPEGVLSKEDKEGIRQAWESQNEGSNAGRVVVLDQAVSMGTVSVNSDVANFLSNVDFAKTQIAKAFGVPDSYLNGAGDQQSSLDMTKSLYANTLRRYVKPIESELSATFGVDIALDESSAVDADNSTLISQIQTLLSGSNPAITSEQAQTLLHNRGVI